MAYPTSNEQILPNGLRLIVVESHDLPIAAVTLYVRPGAADDPEGKEGLSEILAEILTRGTTIYDAEQIAQAVESVGGKLEASSSADYLSLSIDIPAEQLALALDLLANVALRPTFPARELERLRVREISRLRSDLSSPQVVAQRAFSRLVYGESDAYGRAPTGESLRAIERDDVLALYRDRFVAANALLVVSGDVETARVEELARRRLGGWGAGVAHQAPPVTVADGGGAHIYLADRPGSVQYTILVGTGLEGPENDDFYALQVLNRILGGGADSRLFRTLRQEKGWTYVPASQLVRLRSAGYLIATADVRSEVVDSALVEILAQFRQLSDEPVTAGELDAARGYLSGSFPLRIQTADQIADQSAERRLLELPPEDLVEYREKIEAVTVEDVQRVARRYLRPAQTVIVVVGDAPGAQARLRKIAPVAQLRVEEPDGHLALPSTDADTAVANRLEEEVESAGSVAPARSMTVSSRSPRIPVERYTLPNGLEVILSVNRTAPVVATDLIYRVGSRDERPGRTGFAHLFEHMMLQGSANVAAGEYARLLESAGGISDARTTEESTEFFAVVPSNRLNLVLWLEADRMRSLAVTQEDLDNQLEVVLEERRMRIDNQAYADAGLAASEALFGPGCFAYAHPVLGSEADLRTVRLRELRDFFASYYVPGNATLALVGDFDLAEARALIRRYFGSIPGRSVPPRARCDEPFATLPKQLSVRDDKASLPAVLLSYGAPAANDQDSYPLELLAVVLGQGTASRLERRLVAGTGVALLAQASITLREGPGVFQVIGVANQGSTAERVLALLDEEVRRICREGLSEAELRRAQLQRRAGALRELRTVFGRAEYLQALMRTRDNPAAVALDFERYDEVSPDAIRRVACRYLIPARRVVTVVQPAR